eukprot:jgi/Undpi1/11711/HiC_scaffold_37.g14006.m1
MSADSSKFAVVLGTLYDRRVRRTRPDSPHSAMAHLLAVDDSAENLAMIELYLADTGYRVTKCASGREALDRVAREDVHLILLDVVMPGLDGFEVCRRLKNDPRTAFVPVIFLSARMVDESKKLEAYAMGAVDYIQKPVNKDELVARIGVMLRLEEQRTKLERQNAELHQRLSEEQRRHSSAARECGLLGRLVQLDGEEAAVGVVRLDVDGRVLAVEAGERELTAGLQVGARLAEQGNVGKALARALRSGVASHSLVLPGEQPLRVRASVQQMTDGGRVVWLRSDDEQHLVRSRIEATRPAELPEGAAEESGEIYRVAGYVGDGKRAAVLHQTVEKLRHNRCTVLIQGESGTGKELVSRALHFDGPEPSRSFVPIHCGAISRDLIESELFGYEKGAFTGAQDARDGLFQVADGGTVFLDEIGETSMAVQVKLLRVLQMGEVRPVGANHPSFVDVRILAATNRDLWQMVQEGSFREDLYYRLQVVNVDLPALRDRIEDLPNLLRYFLRRGNQIYGREERPVQGVSRGALHVLQDYPWPGNARELENVVDRAFALGVGDQIDERDLPSRVREPRHVAPASVDLTPRPRRSLDRERVTEALRRAGGDKTEAARILGVSRATFYRRLREFEDQV